LTELKKVYSEVDFVKLDNQIALLPDLIREKRVKEVTSVHSLLALISDQPTSFVSEVVTLSRIYMILLVTPVTAERSFSALRRLKTYQRLNNVMLTHCHRGICDTLPLKPACGL
jgi:hypothetical protein